jgi:hypothetical protein
MNSGGITTIVYGTISGTLTFELAIDFLNNL